MYDVRSVSYRYTPIICPNRINLPSTRSQWQKIEWEKKENIATRGMVRADLFYWDCLYDLWNPKFLIFELKLIFL